MKIFTLSFLILLTILTGINSNAQAPDWAWARSYGGSGTESAQKIAVDSRNGVYSYGTFNSAAIQIGTLSFTNAGAKDILLVKHDTSGNLVWAKSFGGTGIDDAGSITTDRAGNIIIAGSFQNTVSIGSGSLTSTGNMDAFIAKLDTYGNVVWVKQFSGPGNEIPAAIKCDIDNNIYIAGEYTGSSVSIGSFSLPATLLNNLFYCKLTSAGNAVWAKKSSSDLSFSIHEIEFLNSQRIVLSGTASGIGNINFDPSPLNPTGLPIMSYKAFVVKLDTSGAFYSQSVTPAIGSLTNQKGINVSGKNIYSTGSWQPLNTAGGGPFAYLIKCDTNNSGLLTKVSGALSFSSNSTSTTTDIVVSEGKRCFSVGNSSGGIDFRDGFSSNFPNSSFIWETDTSLTTKGLLYTLPGNGVYSSFNNAALDTATNSLYIAGSVSKLGGSDYCIIGHDTLSAQGDMNFLTVKININGYIPPSTYHTLSACAGSSVSIGGAPQAGWGQGPFTFAWTPATGLSNAFIASPVATASASTEYVLKITNALNNVFYDTTKININPLPTAPVITAGGPLTFCQGGSVALSSATGHNYLWSNGSTTQSINVTASGTFSVRDSMQGCVSNASLPVTVAVNPVPAVPVITAGGPLTFCQGGSVALSSTTGHNYLWSNGSTTQSINVTASGTFSVRDSMQGCVSNASLPVTVAVNPVPAVPAITAGGPLTFCNGGSVALSSTTGHNYLWSNGSTTQSINVAANGTFSVRDSMQGCVSNASLPVTVAVNPVPAVPVIAAGGPLTFCQGGSVALSSTTGHNYLWSNGSTTQSINVAASGTFSVRDSMQGCVSNTSLPVTVAVNPVPDAPSITQTGNVLSATGSGLFQWYLDNTLISGATGSTYAYFTNGSYRVVLTNTAGCSASSLPFSPVLSGGIITVLNNGEAFRHYVSPNPAQANTSLYYRLSSTAQVSIYISSATGSLIGNLLINQQQLPGDYVLPIGKSLKKLNSGVYLITYFINSQRITDKILIAE